MNLRKQCSLTTIVVTRELGTYNARLHTTGINGRDQKAKQEV